MIKKSIKYFAVVGLNLILLTILLAYWTDPVELTFNSWVRKIEFLKILVVSILALVAIRIAIHYFRKANFNSDKRLVYSAALTLLISLFLYVNYGLKIYQNRIENATVRASLASKIEQTIGLAYGSQAHNLTIEEYTQISNIKWFPKLPETATNISYYHSYDGFLPDYDFELSFTLPLNEELDSTDFSYGEMQVDYLNTSKRVTYNESVD